MEDNPYQKAPIHERVVRFRLQVNKSKFDASVTEVVRALVESPNYSSEKIRSQYFFEIRPTSGGIPIPEATLTQIPQLKSDETSKGTYTLEINPPKDDTCLVSISQLRSKSDVTRYSDLKEHLNSVLPILLDSLPVKDSNPLSTVSLLYDNCFLNLGSTDNSSTPAIAELLPLDLGSQALPGKLEDVEMALTVRPSGNPDAIIKIEQKTLPTKNPHSHVRFKYSINKFNSPNSFTENFFAALDEGHSSIFSLFQSYFDDTLLEKLK